MRRPAERIGQQLENQWSRSGSAAGTSYAESFGRAFNQRFRRTNPFTSDKLGGLLGASFGAPIRGLTTLAGTLTTVTIAGAGFVAVAGTLVTGIAGLGSIAAESAASVALLPAVLASMTGYAAALVVAFEGMGDALSAVMDGDEKKLNAALKELAPSAREAVRAVQQLRPQLAAIRRETQQSLFEGLNDDIARLGDKLLPRLKRGLSRVAEGLNVQFEALLGSLTDSSNIRDFGRILDQTGVAAERAAPGLRSFVDAFTDIAAVGSDFLPKMADGFTTLTEKFADWAKENRESGELRKSMEESIATLKQFGRTVRDFGVAAANVFRAAERASGDFGDRLEGVAKQVRAWTESTEGEATLDTFFEGIAEAADAALPVLIALGKVLTTTVVPLLADVATRTGPAFERFVLGIGTALHTAEPGISALADGIAALLDSLDSDTMESFGDFLGTIGDQTGRVLEEFGPDLAEGLRKILPALEDLARGFADLLVTLSPLLPVLGDVVAWFSGTFGDALSAIAALVKPLVSAFSDLNDSMDGLPATVGAAVAAFLALRRVLSKFSLRKQLEEGTKGTGRVLSDAIERETKNAERTAEKSGKRIGSKLRKGILAVAGTSAAVGIGSSILSDVEDEIEAGKEQLGNTLSGALEVAALASGPWGWGLWIGNEIVDGIFGVDLVDKIGAFLADVAHNTKDAFSNFLEHGFTDEGLGMTKDVTDLAGGLLGIDTSKLDEVGEKLKGITENSENLRAHLDGVFAGIEETDPSGLKIIKDYLGDISGTSQTSKRNIEKLVEAASSGDAAAIHSLRDALRGIAQASVEGEHGIRGLIEALISGADKLPGEVGGLFNFRDLGESAAEAKPPIDELNGSLKEFKENSNSAGESSGFLNGYLGGVAGASFEAQTNVHGLSNALIQYQTASSTTAQTTMWLQTVLGLTAGVFGSSMALMVQSAIAGWGRITESSTDGMNNFASTVQVGMDRSRGLFSTGMNNLNAVNRRGWGEMRDGTRSGSGDVVSLVAGLADRIVSAVSGLSGPMFQAGIAAMNGLAAGIRAGAGAAEVAAARAASNALAATRAMFRMASPSKAFREIGVYAGEGLALGLLDSRNTVARAATQMAQAALPNRPLGVSSLPTLAGGTGVPAARSAGVSHNRTVNNTWHVHTASQDPRAVAAALQARYDHALTGVV
ncbi:hypothetical protein ABT332_06515 [Saccharomonospora azurea]|uniref:hypothetical protein n=1 Tax=Saccharomonospora azurea TaxID=40988 RepID=UPI003331E4A2